MAHMGDAAASAAIATALRAKLQLLGTRGGAPTGQQLAGLLRGMRDELAPLCTRAGCALAQALTQ